MHLRWRKVFPSTEVMTCYDAWLLSCSFTLRKGREPRLAMPDPPIPEYISILRSSSCPLHPVSSALLTFLGLACCRADDITSSQEDAEATYGVAPASEFKHCHRPVRMQDFEFREKPRTKSVS